MKLLFALSALLLLSACASAPPAVQAESQPAYPAWLEMKPGYAEACVKGGGCVPMTQGELQQLTMEVMNRTLQSCRRLPST